MGDLRSVSILSSLLAPNGVGSEITSDVLTWFENIVRLGSVSKTYWIKHLRQEHVCVYVQALAIPVMESKSTVR